MSRRKTVHKICACVLWQCGAVTGVRVHGHTACLSCVCTHCRDSLWRLFAWVFWRLPWCLFWFAVEHAAHPDAVNCIAIGPHSDQVLATGGDDCKVNLWRIGNPQNLLVRSVGMAAVLFGAHRLGDTVPLVVRA